MSTDSHSAMAVELSRLRAALREIETKAATLARLPLPVEERLLAAWISDRAHSALAGGESAPTYYRALIWDENGTTYRVGEGEPRPVTAWNVRLWFEDGDSTHFHTDAPRRRRQL